MKQTLLSLSALTIPLVQAVLPPNIDGMNIVWSESFQGCAGCSPSEDVWHYALDVNTNNEIQTYTTSNENVQLSGGDTVQIVPIRGADGQWTSGRIETKESFTPQPGKKMQVQGEVRVGNNANKAGLWPALWMLGDAMRHGTQWPQAGEIDIYEQINGDMQGHGTVHCGSFPGGPCNEPTGLAETINIPDNDFHTWAVVIDRTTGDWQTETITWMMDGNAYHVLAGAEIADEGIWGTLAHSPLYLLANVAVGGDWPGNPTDATEDSWGSMMEISYISVYETS